MPMSEIFRKDILDDGLDWVRDEVEVCDTIWNEHDLRQYLDSGRKIRFIYKQKIGRHIWEHRHPYTLYKHDKRFVTEYSYKNGFRETIIMKHHYKIGQVVKYLNTKEWETI